MQSCIFNLWLTRRSDGLHHLMLHLPAWTYLGLDNEAACPPLKFTLAFLHNWLMPIGFFLFTGCVPTPWVFSCAGLSAVSDLGIYLRTPLLRVLSRMNVSSVIGGGSEVIGGSFQLFLRDLNWFPSDLLGDIRSSPVDGSLTFLPLVWRRFFRYLDSQNSQFSRGSWIIGGTASLSWAVSLEVFSQPPVLVVPLRRISWRVASLISDSILG